MKILTALKELALLPTQFHKHLIFPLILALWNVGSVVSCCADRDRKPISICIEDVRDIIQ